MMRIIGKRLTTVEVIEEFKVKNGGDYDYSKVCYIGDNDKVIIICSKHGEFSQTPNNHKRGKGCPKCVGKNLTFEELLEVFSGKHNYKYDYSKVKYVNNITKVVIICPEHGEFSQTPNAHKAGKGCYECGGNKPKSMKKLVTSFNQKHSNAYDYSLINYKNFHTPITIICPKHGEFSQTPNNHKRGQGCPICKESKGEREIRKYLIDIGITFACQYMFDDCKDKRCLPFDFYLPDLNVCIEYQGEQHYHPVPFFGGVPMLKERQSRDKIKEVYCANNNIPLIKIRYDEDVIFKLQDLKRGEITV